MGSSSLAGKGIVSMFLIKGLVSLIFISPCFFIAVPGIFVMDLPFSKCFTISKNVSSPSPITTMLIFLSDKSHFGNTEA